MPKVRENETPAARERRRERGKARSKAKYLERYATEEGREAMRAMQREAYRKRRDWVQQVKLDRGCKDCGYNTHFAALHFHHVRGQKVSNISKMRGRAAIKAEIDKCDVLCANCHSIHTFNGALRIGVVKTPLTEGENM